MVSMPEMIINKMLFLGEKLICPIIVIIAYTSQVKINKKFQPKTVNIFLPIILSIRFVCSKEPSH